MENCKLTRGEMMTTPHVKVYSGRLCTYCNAAKRLLESKGVKYQEIMIDIDQSMRKEMEKLSGRTSVPQIFIGDTHVGGFDDLAELNREGKLSSMLGLE